MFPQKLREDPLLLDKLRRHLSPDLSVLPDRSQQERLLLHIAVGAASRRLYLSYPRLEVAEARARVPSFYALDVARSITGHVPDYEVLAREAELAGAKSGLMQQLLQNRAEDSVLAAGWTAYLYRGKTYEWSKQFEQKLAAVTLPQLNAAFRKAIDPAKLSVVMAGDQKKATPSPK